MCFAWPLPQVFARNRVQQTAGPLLLALCLATGLPGRCFASSQAAASTQSAKDIAGTWQGTLHLDQGRNLRTVLKITRGSNGALAATFYSIDQGGDGLPVTKIAFVNGTLTYSIPGPDLHYEGKMSPDGNTLTGTSTQFDRALPLNLDRTTPATAWEIPAPAPPMKTMAADADPSFEIATIKPNVSGNPGQGFTLRGDHILTINTSVIDILCFAYGISKQQIVGGPEWLSTDKFDIDGKADVPGLPSIKQSGTMLKKLMADRFQLKLHEDHKEMSAYVLTVAAGGAKLENTGAAPDAIPGLGFSAPGNFHVHDATLGEVAGLLQTIVFARPVVDQTGIQGRFTFNVKWRPDETQFTALGPHAPQPAEGTDALPSIYTAFKDTLGLQLTAGKPQVPVLVIDHIDHPSAN